VRRERLCRRRVGKRPTGPGSRQGVDVPKGAIGLARSSSCQASSGKGRASGRPQDRRFTVLRGCRETLLNETHATTVEWNVRFVQFHGMRSRAHLFPAEPKIESFLTDLAVRGHVAAATQNQARDALVVLYTRALNRALPGRLHAVRADEKVNLPMVMTRAAVAAVISRLDGTAQPGAQLLDRSGLRLMEAVRRRVQTRHQQDLAPGHGEASPPPALARKHPHAAKAWGWPSVFPARNRSAAPRAGGTRRHHVAPRVRHKAIQGASAVPA
jgi:Phage integrase, N-terminal SAM-like domain